MYGFEDLIEVAPDQLLQKITQEQIIEWVLEQPFDINARYISPFRKDEKPGCRLEVRPDGTILFIDFGEKLLTGRTHRTCFGMVMDKYKVSMQGAIRILCNEFGLSTHRHDYQYIESPGYDYSKSGGIVTPSTFTYDKKEFSKSDIIYWSGFMIKPEHLIEDNSFCVRRFTISNHKGFKLCTPYQYCYVFDFIDKVKFYQPFNEKYKWITNCDENCIGNIDNLPSHGKELFVQKSYKDHRVLRNLGWGLNVIWFQNEGCIPSLEILYNLTQRFDLITIFYDNDAHGIATAYKLVEIFNSLKPGCARMIYLPERRKHKKLYGKFLKDPAEFYNKEGRDDLIKVLKQIGIKYGRSENT